MTAGFMFTFDPLYFLLAAPALILGLWAQMRVKSTYHATSQVAARSGATGAQAAARIMEVNGVRGVGIEPVQGTLSDHYDPRAKMLRLSHDVYYGQSLASLGIAAHEAGHAIQDKERYGPLVIRNGIVPFAMIGPNLGIILFMIGLALSAGRSVAGQWLMLGGIGLFTLVVLFQLVNLPVEFDASKRANRHLVDSGLVSAGEAPAVRKVLSAAALTYVAATLSAVMTLVYLLIRAQSASSNRD